MRLLLLLTLVTTVAVPQEKDSNTESDIHSRFRIRYANALEGIILRKERDDHRRDTALAEIKKLKEGPFELHTFVEEYAYDREDVQLLGIKMKYCDTCLIVYKDTIDKKQSDLTTREQEAIQACRGLDMYPPER